MLGKRGVAVFMLSPERAHEPVPAGADVFDLPIRRSTTSRSKASFDDCQDIVKAIARDAAFKRELPHRRGELDQLGARRRADRLLLQRLLRRRRRANAQRVSSPCRRATSATSSPATSPGDGPADRAPDPRDERERRARRVLPHRPLSARGSARDARDVVAVDGHQQGVELRALRVRLVGRDRAPLRALLPTRCRGTAAST